MRVRYCCLKVHRMELFWWTRSLNQEDCPPMTQTHRVDGPEMSQQFCSSFCSCRNLLEFSSGSGSSFSVSVSIFLSWWDVWRPSVAQTSCSYFSDSCRHRSAAFPFPRHMFRPRWVFSAERSHTHKGEKDTGLAARVSDASVLPLCSSPPLETRQATWLHKEFSVKVKEKLLSEGCWLIGTGRQHPYVM